MRIDNTGFHRVLACCVACAVALSVTYASAQPATIPASAGDDRIRPWATGVSDAEQEVARGLYLEGNAEFMESRFARALAKYRDALRHWDHPAIHFNVAICLINLDQLVEASDELERSLAYGAAPLGQEAYAQSTTYRKLLGGQLAHVTATCSVPGSVITLDGKYLFTAPGNAKLNLLPGEHQLAAIKPGLRTAFKTFVAAPGKQAVYDLQPLPELDPPYWQYWKHVLGAGGALATAGAVTYLWARSNMKDFDEAFQERCPDGCDAETARGLAVNAKRDEALMKQTVAFSLWAGGGAAVLTGVLGLILDRPRVRAEASRAVPVVGAVPGGATVALGWPF
jgi:hypothetical protein